MNRTQLLTTAVAAALGLSVGAAAQADQIGLIIPGDKTYWTDLWTNITDTGVDTFVSGINSGQFNVGDVHEFTTQMRVSSFSLNGIPVTIPGTNDPSISSGFEITKVIKLTDTIDVAQPAGPPAVGQNVQFSSHPGQTGTVEIYYDPISNTTDQSQAIPGNQNNTVRCYGTGVLGGANCPPAPDQDGTLILSGTLLSSTSGFTANNLSQGTGSFDVTWQLGYYSPTYIDVSRFTGNILTDRISGTLTIPTGSGTAVPVQMWDGTPFPSVNSPAIAGFKVDSSEDFGSRVPEPSSLALIGAGLMGLSGLFRRKKV